MNSIIYRYPIIKAWMFPVFDKDIDGSVYCMFYTSNGFRHDIRCKWNNKLQAWTLRFKGCTWIASTKKDLFS